MKKVVLSSVKETNNHLEIGLQLIHFVKPIKEIRAFYECDGNQFDLSWNLDKQKKNITVNIPEEHISKMENKGVISLLIDGKKMWISSSNGSVDANKFSFIKHKYYSFNAHRNIIMRRQFAEYQFSETNIGCEVINTEYDALHLRWHEKYPFMKEKFGFYVLKNNQIKEMEVVTENQFDQNVILQDFSQLTLGKWKLFIRINEIFYPVTLKNEEAKQLKSYKHVIEIVNEDGVGYFVSKSHLFQCKSVLVSDRNEENFRLQIDSDSFDKQISYKLIINDMKMNHFDSLELEKNQNGALGVIPIEILLNGSEEKRFFIETLEKEKVLYQFDLDIKSLSKTRLVYDKIMHSQKIEFQFYKRKDRNLGVKFRKPRLIKLISKIEMFNISGFVKKNKKFENCQTFMLIEDRYSLKSIKIPIRGKFLIDLEKINLASIKSKEKTVMDFFVIVCDQDGNIIKKEKIKYKKSDYKKDNYYGHYISKDGDGNHHHFLLTTTPYHNLKVESFMIPCDVSIPNDSSKKDLNVWLIGERYDTAQDNGIIFFNWLQKNTTIDAYYVIEENSVDYEKIKENPNVLTFGSKKHFEIAFKAKVLAGTHDLENLLPYKPAKGFFHYEDTYKVFLQHGVLGRKNVEYHKKFYDFPFDIFIVSSEPEKYDVVMDKLGYTDEDVEVTGLARFDNFKENQPKDILLMPTWRDWINTDEDFLSSEYYDRYIRLINNRELADLLEKYNVNLNFYPHYRAQNYFKNNVNPMNKRINFVTLGTRTVQDLLIEHALLITDFSSVSFDFTIMKKPVIYYHFDAPRFFKNGILRPINETFLGRIGYSEEDMVKLIKERIECQFENYHDDISGIIKYQDHFNSKRIYEKILEKQMKK